MVLRMMKSKEVKSGGRLRRGGGKAGRREIIAPIEA